MNSSSEWKNNNYVITLSYSKEELEALSKVGHLLEIIQLITVGKFLTDNGLIKFDKEMKGVEK
jgi:hypothetical protein